MFVVYDFTNDEARSPSTCLGEAATPGGCIVIAQVADVESFGVYELTPDGESDSYVFLSW